MEKLPYELVAQIIEIYALDHSTDKQQKQQVCQLRLVCRLFNRIVSPMTFSLAHFTFPCIHTYGEYQHPSWLSTQGHLCKALYVDTMVLRDQDELEYMDQALSGVVGMEDIIAFIRQKWALQEEEEVISPAEYVSQLTNLLGFTPNLERFRLNLPFQLVGLFSDASTLILSNTLSVLARAIARPALPNEDPETMLRPNLKVLVLESVADQSILKLCNNPIDIHNISIVFGSLEHIVVGMRRQVPHPEYATKMYESLGHNMWTMFATSGRLRSLSLTTLDDTLMSRDSVEESIGLSDLELAAERACSLPFFKPPPLHLPGLSIPSFPHLRYLEFKRVELDGRKLMAVMDHLPSLDELFLTEVCLQTFNASVEESKVMWIGLPNKRPPEDHCWIAVRLRQRARKLSVVRASRLAYHRLSPDPDSISGAVYDLADPCGLDRTLAQRFVEVAIGYKQPDVKKLVISRHHTNLETLPIIQDSNVSVIANDVGSEPTITSNPPGHEDEPAAIVISEPGTTTTTSASSSTTSIPITITTTNSSISISTTTTTTTITPTTIIIPSPPSSQSLTPVSLTSATSTTSPTSAPSTHPIVHLPPSPQEDYIALPTICRPSTITDDNNHLPPHLTDTREYQLRHSRNTTSDYVRSLDGWFRDSNAEALKELDAITQVASRGMRQFTINQTLNIGGMENIDEEGLERLKVLREQLEKGKLAGAGLGALPEGWMNHIGGND